MDNVMKKTIPLNIWLLTNVYMEDSFQCGTLTNMEELYINTRIKMCP